MTLGNKRELLQYPYPINLFLTLLNCTVEPPEFTDDILAGLEYVISTLNDRQREVLRQRYQERKTYKAIAASFGVTTSRSRDAEYLAFRKMRHPSKLGFILYGKQGYADMGYKFRSPWKTEKEQAIEETKLDTDYKNKTIESMDISVGAENRLRRAGYEYVVDIVNLTYDQILEIPYLPRKNCKEIAWKLWNLGLKDTCWKYFQH